MGYNGTMLSVHIVILVLVFLVLVSIVWTTLRLGISPMPSSAKARQAMLAEGGKAGEGIIVDLGSGWGTLAMAFARQYPQRQVIGYELSFFPWLISVLLKNIFVLNNLVFYRRNFFDADLSNAAVLLCYLYPRGMTALRDQLSSAAMGGTLVISNTFALPEFKPVKVVRLNDLYLTPIYIYHHNPIHSLA